MASDFTINFSNPKKGCSIGEADNTMDLDAIIAQLGQLESQLSFRESEIQVAANASKLAEKSVELDRELSSVLQELNDLQNENVDYVFNHDPIEPSTPGSDDSSLHLGYSTLEDAEMSFHHSESKNSLSSHSRQSSQSSGSSIGVGNPTQQTLVKIYSLDGACKTIAINERTTVGKVCQVLAGKHRVVTPLNWSIVEHLPTLHIERLLEDHLLLLDQINLWTKDSKNRLVFVERPEKYSIFNDKELKDAAANNSFSPSVDGFLHFKLDGKKTWKRLYFVLRASGLYYNPKGKGKAASDLVCLMPLKGVDFYHGFDFKKAYKAPTEFGFALKLPMIQKEVPKFIRFFCMEDRKSYVDWVTAFRLVKHGRQLYDSFVQTQMWVTSDAQERRAKIALKKTAEIPENLEWEESTDESTVSDNSILLTAQPELPQTPTYRSGGGDYGTLKKSIPNLPITTNLTRHLSLQQKNLVRTLPKSLGKPTLSGFQEDGSQQVFPFDDGNFMRFPSPDFSLDQESCSELSSNTATLPRQSLNRMPPNHFMSVRGMPSAQKYDTLSSRRVRSPCFDRSSTFANSINSQIQHSKSSSPAASPFASRTPDPPSVMPSHEYGRFPSTGHTSPCVNKTPGISNADTAFPLPPPPAQTFTKEQFDDFTASDQHLPLPPPPPELLSPDYGIHESPYSFGFSMGSSDYSTLPNSPCYTGSTSPSTDFTIDRNRAGSCRRTSSSSGPASPPPPPPTRSADTRLSFRACNPRTRHIIQDLDRVMVQKQEQGADGLSSLEVPLPPHPVYNDNFLQFVDPSDLPPPPAEILESLKYLRNRPLPPLPPGVPPLHRPMFSKVI